MLITIAYTGLRLGEAIGLERGYLHPGEIHVEWQLRELNGKFHRLPPKDDSYRSPRWEPCLPVDLPPFLAELLTSQARNQGQARDRCACAAQHEGSGQYVFLGPDGGHHWRSNYARRVFRPACDGRYQDAPSRPARLVIADTTTWPGTPIAAWPPAKPGTDYAPPRGHGITPIPKEVPLTCWLPIRPGLTPHGLRHSHKTWMAEDGIPEILAGQRLGHDVPGMRGLYATPPPACATTSKPPSSSDGKAPCATAPPSTRTHPSRCSTSSSPSTVARAPAALRHCKPLTGRDHHPWTGRR
jgi:hypothetical protein